MSLQSDISLSGYVRSISAVLPPLFTRETNSVLYNFLSGCAVAFNITGGQLNELYDKTFISRASDNNLDNLIYDLSKIRRKINETDADYRTRYYRYVFRYNSTIPAQSGTVNDIFGEYPLEMVELGERNGYWTSGNVSHSGNIYFYDDVSPYAPIWADSLANNKFIGYIYLSHKPESALIRNELCNVLNFTRATGTTIYLVYPTTYVLYDTIYRYDDEDNSHYS